MTRPQLPFRLSVHCFLTFYLLLLGLSFGTLASAQSFPVLSTENCISSAVPALPVLNTPELEEQNFPALPSQFRTASNILRLTKDGVVRSRNPVWNVCVSGKPIRKGLVIRNADTYEYRRGHLHLRIPFTCRDYHQGDVSIWRHPDFKDLDILLDAKGRLIGGIPFPYVSVRD